MDGVDRDGLPQMRIGSLRPVPHVAGQIVVAGRDARGVPCVGAGAVGRGHLIDFDPSLVAVEDLVGVVAKADHIAGSHAAGGPLNGHRVADLIGPRGRAGHRKRLGPRWSRGNRVDRDRLGQVGEECLRAVPHVTGEVVRAGRDARGVPRVGTGAIGGGHLVDLDPSLIAVDDLVNVVTEADDVARGHAAGRPLDIHRVADLVSARGRTVHRERRRRRRSGWNGVDRNRLRQVRGGRRPIAQHRTGDVIRAGRHAGGVPGVGTGAISGGHLTDFDPLLVAVEGRVGVEAQTDRAAGDHIAGRPLDVHRIADLIGAGGRTGDRERLFGRRRVAFIRRVDRAAVDVDCFLIDRVLAGGLGAGPSNRVGCPSD